MLPVTRILCPTDFSQAAEAGVKAAAELAGHFRSAVRLVHVIAPIPPMAHSAGVALTYDIPGYIAELKKTARDSLDEIMAGPEFEPLDVTASVEEGEPARAIVETAAREDVDMIVIATHGESGWRRFVFGSVAERVVRLAEQPVLTVQPPHED